MNNNYNQNGWQNNSNNYNQGNNGYNQIPNNNYYQGGYNGYNVPGKQNNQGNGFGIASLVLGILSVLGIVILVGPIILAPLSIIFGIIQLVKKGPKGLAITGIIISIFSIIITIAIGVAIVNYVESGNSVNDFRNILEKATDDEEFKELYTDYVYGDWQYPEGALLSLSKDGNWRFYKDGNDKTDNYYEGSKIVLKQGREGLKEFGGNENFEDKYDKINVNKIYYLELYIDKQIVNGKDKVAAGDYDNIKDQLVMKRLIVLPKDSFDEGVILQESGGFVDRCDITRK